MKFDVYGPFEIPKGNRGLIVKDGISDFWAGMDSKVPGLAIASGCYVFATKSSGGPKATPWYVGKAEKTSFKTEVLNSSNISKYNQVLDEFERAKPMLFLLPQIDSNHKFRKKTLSKRPAIGELESMLIGMGITQNEDLLNISGTKMQRKLEVAGFFNTRLATRGSSKELRDAFGR